MMMKKIMIIAGEPSGDLHGSNLAKELFEARSDIRIFGVGGRLMQQAGVEICFNILDLAVVGFIEVLRELKELRHLFKKVLVTIDSEKPDLVILIDYPGFNLRIAQHIKKRGLPIIYYISPQVWAWGKSRIETIKRVIDRMIVVFEFEKSLYQKNGVNVHFVGHPLVEVVRSSMSQQEARMKFNLSGEKITVGLLPGSRKKEVERHLPIMIEASRLIHKRLNGSQFLISKSPIIPKEIFDELLKDADIPITVIEGQTYDCLNISHLCLVASGTATLEAAIMGKPMIVVYKVSLLTWLLAKPQITIPHIGLVNVVAGRQIVPEFLQYGARPKRIANEALDLLSHQGRMSRIRDELAAVRERLGGPGASRRAARIVLDTLAS